MVTCANFAIQGHKLATMACHLLEAAVTLAPTVKYCEWFVIFVGSMVFASSFSPYPLKNILSRGNGEKAYLKNLL